jgi:hypothetical protein
MQYLPDNLVLPYDLKVNVLSDATGDLVTTYHFDVIVSIECTSSRFGFVERR